ncbi:hypothetical protein N431DRAFT_241729 [Stipitochalara longipes BDJ]|nr:hypothetical protein N431DRAFT_241729 [Stipitochalara longipes BDJ]
MGGAPMSGGARVRGVAQSCFRSFCCWCWCWCWLRRACERGGVAGGASSGCGCGLRCCQGCRGHTMKAQRFEAFAFCSSGSLSSRPGPGPGSGSGPSRVEGRSSKGRRAKRETPRPPIRHLALPRLPHPTLLHLTSPHASSRLRAPEILLTIHRLAHPGNAPPPTRPFLYPYPSPATLALPIHAECGRLRKFCLCCSWCSHQWTVVPFPSLGWPVAWLLAWLMAAHLHAMPSLPATAQPSAVAAAGPIPPLSAQRLGPRPAGDSPLP